MKIPLKLIGVLSLTMISLAVAEEADKVNVQLAMANKVNPEGLALWDVTNNAMDDDGYLDPKKLTAEKWAQLLEIGQSLEQTGKMMASGKEFIAAAPGTKLQDESPNSFSAADVQRFIDAKPDLFREKAQVLSKTGTEVIAAAKTHDVKKLDEIANSLDGVCESCHQNFWYPQQ